MSTESVNIVIAGQNKAAAALNSAADGMRRMSKSAGSAASAMKALVAVQVGGILARGFASATSSVNAYVSELRNSVDATGKLAARTGIAVEALQSFQIAGGLSGVGDMTEMISKMGTTIGQALVDPARKKAFTDIGLDFEKLAMMAPEDQFRAIGKAIDSIPSPAAKAAAATKIFSEQGVKLLPLFAGNLAEVEARAQRLGIVLSGQQVGAIESMNDALSLVDQTFKGIIGQVTANLAPVVTDLANQFMGFVEGFKGVAGATGGNALADAITSAFFDIAETFAGMFDYLLSGFSDFSGVLDSVVKGFQFVADVFTAVYHGFKLVMESGQLMFLGVTHLIGKLIEKVGGLISRSAAELGRSIQAEAEAKGRGVAQSMQQSAGALQTALGNIANGRQAGGQGSDGPLGSAVAAAREAFGRVRDVDPEAEARKRREREAALAQAQRDAMLKQRAIEYANAMKDAAGAQKELTGLLQERDKLEAERAERMAAKTPENQALIDRFLSRGPQLDANQRTAAATERLAELNQKIKEKQDIVAKAAEQTAKNTAMMFGVVAG